MVSMLEYLGEDGWEFGFSVCAGDKSTLVDVDPEGREELYLIKCESDDAVTIVYRLKEGQYTWISPSAFDVLEEIQPAAMLTIGSTPYESTIMEHKDKPRRYIQITHQTII